MWLRKPPAHSVGLLCLEDKSGRCLHRQAQTARALATSKAPNVPKNLLVHLFSCDREFATPAAVPSVTKSSLSLRGRSALLRSPASLLEVKMEGCFQHRAAGTFTHPDLYPGWMDSSPGLSHTPGCLGVATLAHPQPGKQGGHDAADAPPSGGAGWVTSSTPLHSSVLVSGWSASGFLEHPQDMPLECKPPQRPHAGSNEGIQHRVHWPKCPRSAVLWGRPVFLTARGSQGPPRGEHLAGPVSPCPHRRWHGQKSENIQPELVRRLWLAGSESSWMKRVG